MKRPPHLQKGDTIGITAPAKRITIEEIQPAINIFESWGLIVIIGNTINTNYHQFAATDKERAADFQQMLDSKDIKAIVCARGGYGVVRIIDQLDFSNFQKYPKWIVGFSDITVLHNHIHTNFDIQTLHSDMPIQFPKDGIDNIATDTIRRCLFGENPIYDFASNSLNKIGTAQGKIIGGNLSLLYNTIGTVSDIDTTNKILFIEDLDEYLYHIDRMVIALKRSGKLANLAGLMVGGMTKMQDNSIPFGKIVEEIIVEHVAEYNYPVCYHFPAGHIDDNHALIMGAEITLTIETNKCQLKF